MMGKEENLHLKKYYIIHNNCNTFFIIKIQLVMLVYKYYNIKCISKNSITKTIT